MKLTYRLGVALVLAVFLVLGGFAWVRVQREVALFDGDMRRDHRVLGTTLATTVGEMARDEGTEAAARLVHRVDASRPGVSIRWVGLDPNAPGYLKPVVPSRKLAALSKDGVVQIIVGMENQLASNYGEDRLFSYFPVMAPTGSAGAIELAESLAPKEAYLRDTVRNTVLASLLIALICGALAVVLGVHYVGRPIRRLIEKARQIARGEPGEPLALQQRDELGMLAAEIDAMSRELVAARAKAEDEMEARLATSEQLRHAERLTTVGKLASALAHEVGTPLNVVAGYAKLIARERVAGTEALESAEIIVEQCGRMTKLVRGLLDYARRPSPHRVRTDLGSLVEQTANLLSPFAVGRQVGLELAVEENAIAMVDPAQMQQAVTNIVMNAIQASTAGATVKLGLTRTLAARPARSNGMQDALRLSVIDHGAGIAPEHIPKLFEPFFTTKPSGEGTGLGLGIARHIIEEHEGWISVDSRLGQGSRFDIFVAAVDDSSPSSSGSAPTAQTAP